MLNYRAKAAMKRCAALANAHIFVNKLRLSHRRTP